MKTLRWWVMIVALSVAVAFTVAYGQRLAERLDRAERDRTALAQQVRDLGGTPVAGPKGSDGTDGHDGKDGSPGVDGNPGPTGPTGAQGAPGSDGAPGAAGVQGPAGAAGPQGERGPSGDPGPQGPAGPQGDQGPPADACPVGYEGAIVVIEGNDYFLCRKVT